MLFDGEIFVCFILSSLSLSLLKMYIYIYRIELRAVKVVMRMVQCNQIMAP